MDQNALAGAQLGSREEVVVNGESIFRQRRCLDGAPSGRNRQYLPGSNGDVFGVTAAVGQRANAIAFPPSRNVRSGRRDSTRNLEA